MTETFIKSGTLVNKKFREIFLPTVLTSMAAISACMPLSQITYAFTVLISIGSSGLIAIASGKRDNNEANYIFSTVIATGIFSAAIWAVFLILNSSVLPNVLSSAENLRGMMQEYLTFFYRSHADIFDNVLLLDDSAQNACKHFVLDGWDHSCSPCRLVPVKNFRAERNLVRIQFHSVAEEKNFHTDGIMLLKNLASGIKYNRVLSLNQTFIEI